MSVDEENMKKIGLSDQELLEIEERSNKASPGPWIAEPDLRPDIQNEKIYQSAHYLEKQISVYHHYKEKDRQKKNGIVFSGNDQQIIREMSKTIGHVCELAKYWEENHSNIDDAEFIAHARTDIPRLIEEIRRLKGA
jgi:hypothetical protein